jgi:alpha-beta hydrolase superfamily lysophospholipase
MATAKTGETRPRLVPELAIPTEDGDLTATLHLPAARSCPVVVLSHGLLSWRGSEKLGAIGDRLAEAGIAALRFDFTGCGGSRTRFAHSLLATRFRDLKHAIAYVRTQDWFNGRLGLMGSSMGGFLTILAAGTPGLGVEAAVSFAAPFDFRRSNITAEEMANVLHDFQPGLVTGEPQSLDAGAPVSGLLIVHGTADEVIPPSEAEEIYEWAQEPKRLLMIEGADHQFTEPEHRGEALDEAFEWLRAYLT